MTFKAVTICFGSSNMRCGTCEACKAGDADAPTFTAQFVPSIVWGNPLPVQITYSTITGEFLKCL